MRPGFPGCIVVLIYIMKMKQILPWVIGCQLVGIIGAFFTVEAIPTWYANLVKPVLNPPNSIFGPVWTVLYVLMAIAAYLVSREKKQSDAPMALFFLQLFFNAIWTPLFFGARALGIALIDISLLFILIILTMIVFARVNKIAAWLLLPYLVWVGFATYLNASIWVLNR